MGASRESDYTGRAVWSHFVRLSFLVVCIFTFWNKSSSASAVKENVPVLFCCEATEMFRGNRSQSVMFLVYIKQASLLYTIQNKKNVGICCLDTDQTPNRTDFLSYQISAQWNLK